MQYLIRANKVVFSGNRQMIIKYISNYYKHEAKAWSDKDGNCTDFGRLKMFIESNGYQIRDKIPASCRCEGTAVTNAEFKQIWGEEHFNIKAVATRLHTDERIIAQIARKLKLRK